MLCHANAVDLSERLSQIAGVDVLTGDAFFNEFTIRLPRAAATITEALAAKNILGGVPVSRLLPDDPALKNDLIVASTEINTDADRQRFANALTETLA